MLYFVKVTIYDIVDNIKSYQLFAEIMDELNA